MMNIFKEHWPRLKEELPFFLILVVLQVWINYNFPTWQRLSSPFNSILPVISTLATLVLGMHMLFFPEKLKPLFKANSSFHEFSNPALFKGLLQAWKLIVFHLGWLLVWQIDLYGISSYWYLILYLNWLITLLYFYYIFKKYT